MSGSGRGEIIFLNGASSSGKTSIAQELLRILDTPYFRMGVDDIGAMRAEQRTRELSEEQLATVLRKTRAGFHRAVAGMAEAGNDVVVDHVLSESWRLPDCLDVFRDFRVVFVGVRCSLPELIRRERLRGDRVVGAAAAQHEVVHQHGLYDLECDTESSTPQQCAAEIKTYRDRMHAETAFEQLRRINDERDRSTRAGMPS